MGQKVADGWFQMTAVARVKAGHLHIPMQTLLQVLDCRALYCKLQLAACSCTTSGMLAAAAGNCNSFGTWLWVVLPWFCLGSSSPLPGAPGHCHPPTWQAHVPASLEGRWFLLQMPGRC
jgi:hypothetical protein